MQPFTGVSRTRFGGRDNGTFQEKAEAVSAARDHISGALASAVDEVLKHCLLTEEGIKQWCQIVLFKLLFSFKIRWQNFRSL